MTAQPAEQEPRGRTSSLGEVFSPASPLQPAEYPTQKEQTAANAGNLAPKGVSKVIQRLAKSWAVRLGLIGAAGVSVYEAVPAVHQKVDSLPAEATAWWNSLFMNKDVVVAPSGIPQFQPSVSSEYITPVTTGKSPQELAKEAGYNILWMNPNDKTGRTVFYDYRGGWGGGIGESFSEQKGTDGKIYRHLIFLTGQFVRFESIDGSKDKYIIMRNPKTGDLFQKIRVDFEGKEESTEGKTPTSLLVENLSFARSSVGNNEGVIRDGLGYVPQWSEDKLSEIFREGDAIGIGLTWVRGISTASWVEEENKKTEVVTNPFAASISLHRFGGKGQIEKELVSH